MLIAGAIPPLVGPNLVDGAVAFHDEVTLRASGGQALPPFCRAGDPFPGHGRFVFVDRDAAVYRVIIEADPTAGLINNFGITTYPL